MVPTATKGHRRRQKRKLNAVEVGDWSVGTILLSTPDDMEYFVKWTDYGITESSWLSRQNLLDSGYGELIKLFKKRQSTSPLHLIIDQLKDQLEQKDVDIDKTQSQLQQLVDVYKECRDKVVSYTSTIDHLRADMGKVVDIQVQERQRATAHIAQVQNEYEEQLTNVRSECEDVSNKTLNTLVQKQKEDNERIITEMKTQHSNEIDHLSTQHQQHIKRYTIAIQTHAANVLEVSRLRSELESSNRRTQQANMEMARVRQNAQNIVQESKNIVQESKNDVVLAQKRTLHASQSAKRLKQQNDVNIMTIEHLNRELMKVHQDVTYFKSQHADLVYTVQQVRDALLRQPSQNVGGCTTQTIHQRPVPTPDN